MNPRPKQKEPVSACDILRELLTKRPVGSVKNDANTGVTSNGKLVIGVTSPTVSYDKDTNRLLRANFACHRDMVLSPNAKDELIYIDREDYDAELAKSSMRKK